MRKLALALAAVLVGCTSTAAPCEREPPTAGSEAPPPCPTIPEPAPCEQVQAQIGEEPPPLTRLEEDLDGDGTAEVIELTNDRRVRVGRELFGPFEGQAPYELVVVDLRRGDGHREVLFLQHIPDSEDSHVEYWFFSLQHPIPVGPIAVENGQSPLIRGDGTIVFRYEHCDMGRTALRRIEYRLAESGEIEPMLEQTSYSGRTCEFAACPFVFVGDEERVLAGEILRDLRGASAEAEQSLELPDMIAADGTLTVTLRELKDEVSYVDEVHLLAGERVIPPRSCSENEEAWCSADGRHLGMSRGSERSFVFDVGEARGVLRLVATGYYVPLASLASDR